MGPQEKFYGHIATQTQGGYMTGYASWMIGHPNNFEGTPSKNRIVKNGTIPPPKVADTEFSNPRWGTAFSLESRPAPSSGAPATDIEPQSS